MPNQIREVHIVNHRLDPTETVLHVLVDVENLTPTTEIRGRFVGPTCAFASTVEIAYSLREIERSDHIKVAIVIPEPNWWESATPFLYEGFLELWHGSRLCQRIQVRHGIRWLQLTSRGLRLNGHAFLLRCKVVEPTCSEMEMQRLHDAGFNTVLTSNSGVGHDLNSLGDQYGLFVSHAINRWSRNGEASVRELDILAESTMQNRRSWQRTGARSDALFQHDTSVLFCQEKELSVDIDITRPKIVATKTVTKALLARPDVIGFIETE